MIGIDHEEEKFENDDVVVESKSSQMGRMQRFSSEPTNEEANVI